MPQDDMLRRILRLILTLACLPVLSGCILPFSNSLPTPYPQDYLPTVIALTAQAANATLVATLLNGSLAASTTPTPEATSTPVPPTPTFSLPTIFPTDTSTPIPVPPLAAIKILAPGPASKVISPIHLKAKVIPSAKKLVQVELLGEDGRLLARDLFRVQGSSLEGAYLSKKIPFEIRAAAEVGRLQISMQDEYGRLQALASVHLILLSSGIDEVNPPGELNERCFLIQPLPKASISGGILALLGEMQPFNNQPVVFELQDTAGKPLGLRLLDFSGLDKQPFTTTIPYKVTASAWARLVVSQQDERFPGLIYLYSQEIWLNP